MLKLQFLDNRQPSMWLVDERISIGRDKSNKVVINDEGVSAFHAELRQEDGKLFIWDSSSVNGTFVNGEKVSGKREVQVGDVLRFYLVDLQVIDPSKGAVELPEAVKRDLDKPALPAWQLKATTGTLSGKMYPVDGTRIIGRDPGCDIVVTGAHVSRRHAEVSLRSGKLWVKDLGSSNGTFVNNKRVEEIALRNGDEVKFDAMTFKVVGPVEEGEVAQESFDEADMTQFRPVVPPKATTPAPKPAPVAAPSPASAPEAAPVTPAPIAPAPAAIASAPIPKAATPKPAAQQPAPPSPLGPIVLIVLAVLAIAAVVIIMK